MSNVAHNLKEGKAKETALGPRTLNHYLLALTTFVGWCITRKRMAASPVADVEKVDKTNDVRRARRALSEEEAGALLDAVPQEYKLVYRTILSTGLRRGGSAAVE